jgi:carbonic anhydrase
MGEDAGSVFVVRNVANLVVNTDFNLMSALQYAVNVLQVEHIIVCGHYDCRGVRASVEKKDHSPPLENWLRNIRDVYVWQACDRQAHRFENLFAKYHSHILQIYSLFRSTAIACTGKNSTAFATRSTGTAASLS